MSPPEVQVVHRLGARVRVRVAMLYRRPEVARRVARRLLSRAGVESVSANPLTATLLVIADAPRTVDALMAELGRLIHDGAGASSGEAREVRASELWHTFGPEQIFSRLDTSARGLDPDEARARLVRFGDNVLAPPARRSELAILLGQLESVPVLLLAGSALLSLATGGVADAVAIGAVVVLNAGIGWLTESRTERIIAELDSAGHAFARVRRSGTEMTIDGASMVPGDLLLLSQGDVVLADAHLTDARDLFVDESTLTGESLPVQKSVEALPGDRLPLADRVNMVFRGTRVTGGSGEAVTVDTGAGTEIGRIQSLVGTLARPDTPLERQLAHLGLQLCLVAAAVCGGVFAIGLLRGRGLLPMLRTSVSLAVAAVPEGLPTVAVTTLALGVRHLRERDVLVRDLEAVETLGAIEVLCLDKTGTITENRMAARTVVAGERRLVWNGEAPSASDDDELRSLLVAAALCNDAEPGRGSPTEVALLELASAAGIDVRSERKVAPRIETRRRSQARSWMSTVHHAPLGPLTVVKGSPAEVLGLACRTVGGAPLDPARRARVLAENERMASEALRVLGFAWGEHGQDEGELTWLGLVGLSDPPRPEVKGLLRRFHEAGIETVMMTGDQSATAEAVARKVGLGRDGRLDLLDSTRLDELPHEVLRALIGNVQVFSRVNPTQKLQIVRGLQEAGRVVAMTGDGINDSPALKAADVGVAMGRSGTSAARETAAVVLEDDRLESLLVAVEQGRTIHDDIKKAVHFVLATNSSEILLTAIQVAAGLGGALTPMQLLWINILTDVFPELALAVEPPEDGVLARPPRDPRARMFRKKDLGRIGMEGLVLTAGALGAHAWGRSRYGDGPHSSTLAFTTLTASQLLHAVSTRSESHSIFDPSRLPRNIWIPVTVGGSLSLQLLVELVPGARRVLGTSKVTAADWLMSAAISVTTLAVNECIKLLWRGPASGGATLYRPKRPQEG